MSRTWSRYCSSVSGHDSGSWFGFGGWGDSRFGDDGLNYDGYRFYTRSKVVTQRWTEPKPGLAPHFVAAGSQ